MKERLILSGLVLLPFSSAPSENFYVISFGLPFLLISASLVLTELYHQPEYYPEFTFYILAAGLLLLSQLISWTYAPSLFQSGARLFTNLIGFVLFIYFLLPQADEFLIVKWEEKYPLAFLLVLSAAVLSLYYLCNFAGASIYYGFEAVIRQRFVGGRMSLPWGASNVIASPLIFPFFLALFGLKVSPVQTGRRFYLISLLLIGGAIAMTFSRGALAGLAVGGLIFLIANITKLGLKKLVFLPFVLTGIALADYLAGGVLFFRFYKGDLLSLNGRMEIWQDYLTYIGEAPWLGGGFYSSMNLHVVTGHNIILTTLAERGVIGFLLASFILVAAARAVLKGADREFYRFAIPGGLAALSHLLLEDANFTQQYIIYSWLYFAVLFRPSPIPGEARLIPLPGSWLRGRL